MCQKPATQLSYLFSTPVAQLTLRKHYQPITAHHLRQAPAFFHETANHKEGKTAVVDSYQACLKKKIHRGIFLFKAAPVRITSRVNMYFVIVQSQRERHCT